MLSADLVLRNGVVITADSNFRTAEAVAVYDGRIVAVGTNSEIRECMGAGTREIDLGGKCVIPGIFDSHNHQLNTGQSLTWVQLADAKNIAELQEAMRKRAFITPSRQWVRASGRWHETRLAEKRLPTRYELDQACPDHPVFIPRGGHVVVVNSCALALAGITNDSQDPKGGRIVRDASGEPTGTLLERPAFNLVAKHIPPPSVEDNLEALRVVNTAYNAVGITSARDAAVFPADVGAYQEAWRRGQLTTRSSLMIRVDPTLPVTKIVEFLDTWGVHTGFGDEMLRIGSWKMGIDGGIESALMCDGYLNEPNYNGVLVTPTEALKEIAIKANRKGWQIGTHCVGDAAVDIALEVYEAVNADGPIYGKRFCLEHAFLPSRKNIEQIKRMGIVVSVQQPLVYSLGGNMLTYWGEERAHASMRHREWLNEGVRIAGGSDSPVTLYDPFRAMWGTITRQTEVAGVLGAEQGLTREETLRLYTIDSAYVTFEENIKGSIEPRKLADFVVLSDNILTCEVDEIKDLKVLATIVGGKVVYERG